MFARVARYYADHCLVVTVAPHQSPPPARPHTATTTSTANISLKAMPCSWSTGHWNCHHWDWDHAPQPQAPEAKSTSWDSSGGGNMPHVPTCSEGFPQAEVCSKLLIELDVVMRAPWTSEQINHTSHEGAARTYDLGCMLQYPNKGL